MMKKVVRDLGYQAVVSHLFTSFCVITYTAKQFGCISWHTKKNLLVIAWICKEVAVNRKLAQGPHNDAIVHKRLINSDKRNKLERDFRIENNAVFN